MSRDKAVLMLVGRLTDVLLQSSLESEQLKQKATFDDCLNTLESLLDAEDRFSQDTNLWKIAQTFASVDEIRSSIKRNQEICHRIWEFADMIDYDMPNQDKIIPIAEDMNRMIAEISFCMPLKLKFESHKMQQMLDAQDNTARIVYVHHALTTIHVLRYRLAEIKVLSRR
jgi:hypothetical protein